MLKLRAEFTSTVYRKTKIYYASDDGCQEVTAVLEKWCSKSIQTGLLVGTVVNELEYLKYSGSKLLLTKVAYNYGQNYGGRSEIVAEDCETDRACRTGPN